MRYKYFVLRQISIEINRIDKSTLLLETELKLTHFKPLIGKKDRINV